MFLAHQCAHRQPRHMLAAWLVLLASLTPTFYVWWWIWRHLAEHHENTLVAWLVLSGGLGISALLFGLMRRQVQRQREMEKVNLALRRRDAEFVTLTAELESRIAERTAQLSAANADLIRFKAITEATTDFINITDIGGRVLYLNQSARRMTGIGAGEDATKYCIKDFAPPWVMDIFEREGFPTAFRDGSWSGEVALQHRDGHEIPMSLVGLIVRSPAGEPEYLACVARDITEQRRITEQLRNALAEERELNVLKSNFISMVSHEIRTPLALILSSSEILSRYRDRLPPEKQQRHLATIEEAVHRMASLVEDVLMFSRAESGRLEFKPAPLELNCFCTQLTDELASAMNRRCPIHLALPANPAQVRVDEALLRHILTNLLSNAVKYSAPGEAVLLEVRHEDSQVLLRVQDHGIGIPEADVKRIFTPFYRSPNAAHIPGTGLGLVIVKRCVERHGGQIQIESREGAGTTVTARLPVYVPGQTEEFTKPTATDKSP